MAGVLLVVVAIDSFLNVYAIARANQVCVSINTPHQAKPRNIERHTYTPNKVKQEQHEHEKIPEMKNRLIKHHELTQYYNPTARKPTMQPTCL
jgi:predicted transcriptional regulator of viral defense system